MRSNYSSFILLRSISSLLFVLFLFITQNDKIPIFLRTMYILPILLFPLCLAGESIEIESSNQIFGGANFRFVECKKSVLTDFLISFFCRFLVPFDCLILFKYLNESRCVFVRKLQFPVSVAVWIRQTMRNRAMVHAIVPYCWR